ncbi:MAG: hypothetical protein LM560_02185 [Desulfurococcaceae archaeon]|nr:hypothetical protein [Desulfurococcaceae archaeon]
MSWNENEVLKALNEKRYINGVGIIDKLPPPGNVRNELDAKLGVCRDRSPRLILVEKINDYMVLIAIPDSKTECDFRVWRYSPNLSPQVKIPTHDDLGKMFAELKKKHSTIDEYLINATIRLLRDRWSIDNTINHYFNALSNDLKIEIKKFLATLKWIGLQEDTNYPPPKYLGSKMSLAVYALLEAGFTISEIRRVIRF